MPSGDRCGAKHFWPESHRLLEFIFRLAISATFLVCALLASVGAQAAAPDCSTGYFEITASAGTKLQVLPTNYPNTCSLIVNNVRVELWVLTADEQHELSYYEIRDWLQRRTGARDRVDLNLSLSNAFSDLLFVFTGRIPYVTHSAPGNSRGYLLANLGDHAAIVGQWLAPTPLSTQPLRGTVTITIRHGGALSFWGILKLKGLELASLLWLLIPLIGLLAASSVPEFMDDYVPVKTIGGGLVGFVLLPGAIVWIAYFIVTSWSASTVPILFAVISVLVAVVLLRSMVNFAQVKQAKFAIYFSDQPPAFHVHTVHHKEAEVGDAPIYSAYFARFVAWLPYKQHCPKCSLKYIIHTASKAETSISVKEYDVRDMGKEKYIALANDAVAKSRPPVNGCPKCGTRSAQTISVERNLRKSVKLAPTLLKMVGGAVGFGIGLLIWHASNLWLPHNEIMDFALEIPLGIVIFVPLALFLYGVYRLLLYVSNQYVSRTSSFFRIWACPSEGFLFEDSELVAEHTNCLSCKKPLVPVRARLPD